MMQCISHRRAHRAHRASWLLISAWILLPGLAGAVPRDDSATSPAGYRCQDANGQTVYSQWPCETPSQTLRVTDNRTAAQTFQAQRNVERDKHLAASMAYARHQSERANLHSRAQPLTIETHPRPRVISHASPDDNSMQRTHRVSRRRDFKALVPKTAASRPGASVVDAHKQPSVAR